VEEETLTNGAEKKRNSLSLYLAIVAILISLVGTGVSIIEAKILRDQQELMLEEKAAAVWPYVTVNSLLSQDTTGITVSFSLQNDGVGPALVGEIKQFFYGKEVGPIELVDSLETRYPEALVIPVLSTSWDRKVLGAGESNTYLRIYLSGKGIDLTAGDFVLDGITRDFCYCSIYNDCWNFVDGEPKKTTGCATGFELN
ncbi:MAG: hypothetical protein AAFN92_18060, partial [Bacteroidota bacterium]